MNNKITFKSYEHFPQYNLKYSLRLYVLSLHKLWIWYEMMTMHFMYVLPLINSAELIS